MMSITEMKLVKQVLRPFAESGHISAETMQELTAVRDESGQKKLDALITRQEAAKLLQVTGQTLINYQHSGDLQAIKLAGKRLVRYRLEDIQGLLSDKVISTKKEV